MNNIIEMARKARFNVDDNALLLTYLTHFADLVAAQEREPRAWVGLTDDDIIRCLPNPWGGTIEDVARRVEAKLKEKNTNQG
jgi:hypothetical protein